MRREARWLCSMLMLGGMAVRASGDGPPGYVGVPLGSLGGAESDANSIDDRGWVAGLSYLPDNQSVHAALWRGTALTDLGTLGGPNSAVLWPVKNDVGLISGVAETDVDQPLGEAWSCAAFFPTVTGKTCRGVVWEHGRIRALPTLGGDNGFATGSNNLRQVVGWAENTVHDSTCVSPQVLQFRAVLWGPEPSQLQELPPLPGDSTSAATALNDRGQVVGISGDCGVAVGGISARHAVLWEDGQPTDLGSLGGEGWNTPMAINGWGDVVGFANAPGHTVSSRLIVPFLWTRAGGFQALPLPPGDVKGQALGINLWRQIVGLSCGPSGCRGVLWQGGQVFLLDSLVGTGLTGTILYGGDIDDLGRIAGDVYDPVSGVISAFRAVPVATAGERAERGEVERHR